MGAVMAGGAGVARPANIDRPTCHSLEPAHAARLLCSCVAVCMSLRRRRPLSLPWLIPSRTSGW